MHKMEGYLPISATIKMKKIHNHFNANVLKYIRNSLSFLTQ